MGNERVERSDDAVEEIVRAARGFGETEWAVRLRKVDTGWLIWSVEMRGYRRVRAGREGWQPGGAAGRQ